MDEWVEAGEGERSISDMVKAFGVVRDVGGGDVLATMVRGAIYKLQRSTGLWIKKIFILKAPFCTREGA